MREHTRKQDDDMTQAKTLCKKKCDEKASCHAYEFFYSTHFSHPLFKTKERKGMEENKSKWETACQIDPLLSNELFSF